MGVTNTISTSSDVLKPLLGVRSNSSTSVLRVLEGVAIKSEDERGGDGGGCGDGELTGEGKEGEVNCGKVETL